MPSRITRRDFLRASSAILAALGVPASALLRGKEAAALERELGGAQVVWLEAQSCSGCSVSLLNEIYYDTIDQLLVNTLDLQYHPTVMAAPGTLAVAAAERAYRAGGYVLVIEGAIPMAAGGEYCHIWPGMTAARALDRFARRAAHVLAVGTCACYGGVVAGAPNPTEAEGVPDTIHGKRVVKIPGCPSHPDWIVGTIAGMLSTGALPDLDVFGRPLEFYRQYVHTRCPLRTEDEASTLGATGCLAGVGCNGWRTRADCAVRKWNAGEKGGTGVNWCIGGGGPCLGCTEPGFPDEMSPFFHLE